MKSVKTQNLSSMTSLKSNWFFKVNVIKQTVKYLLACAENIMRKGFNIIIHYCNSSIANSNRLFRADCLKIVFSFFFSQKLHSNLLTRLLELLFFNCANYFRSLDQKSWNILWSLQIQFGLRAKKKYCGVSEKPEQIYKNKLKINSLIFFALSKNYCHALKWYLLQIKIFCFSL